MQVFVVIPVFNEGEALHSLLEQVSRYVPPSNIVVVDDGSTPPVEQKAVHVRLVRHRVNLGKGMALKTGCELAIDKGAEILVLMDGDGQHDPSDIPRLISALEEADIVFAARQLDRDMPFVRRAGNWLLNRCARLLFRLDLRDIWCGYRAFKAGRFDEIKWDAYDYAVDVEMAIRAKKHGLHHQEVQIGTIYHDAYKGVTVFDGLRLLFRLVGWKLTL